MNALVLAALLLLAGPAGDMRVRRLEVLGSHVLRPGDMRCGDYFARTWQNTLVFHPESEEPVRCDLSSRESKKSVVMIDEGVNIPFVTLTGDGGNPKVLAVRISTEHYIAARMCLPFRVQSQRRK